MKKEDQEEQLNAYFFGHLAGLNGAPDCPPLGPLAAAKYREGFRVGTAERAAQAQQQQLIADGVAKARERARAWNKAQHQEQEPDPHQEPDPDGKEKSKNIGMGM